MLLVLIRIPLRVFVLGFLKFQGYMHIGGLVRKLGLRCRSHKILHCCAHNHQYVILTDRR